MPPGPREATPGPLGSGSGATLPGEGHHVYGSDAPEATLVVLLVVLAMVLWCALETSKLDIR